jgi:endonuclease/exonuclease/phosphatase family metal-dependent hydrolase
MGRSKRLCAVAVVTLFLAGCGDRTPVGTPSNDVLAARSAVTPASVNGLTVMQYNVYYGADYEPLLTAETDEIPFVAAQAWAAAVASDFPGRAAQIAAEIAAAGPQLVALQEAALYRVQHPSDAIYGGTEPATDVAFDFIALIQDALAARGLTYTSVAADSTTDIELPVYMGGDPYDIGNYDDVRLTDRDAVLARADLAVSDPQHGVYAYYIPVAGSGVKEGWSSVQATVGGITYRFVSTHLEFQQALEVQLAQAQELLDLLADETLPTIVAGDFNSDAYNPASEKATPSLGMMLDAGFVDTWSYPTRTAPGLTCCQANDLLNAYGRFDAREDFVFTRNLPANTPAGTRVVGRKIVGGQPGDRLPSGLWPSDHAAVVVTLRTP